jgi:hypothetical protein
MAYLNCILTFLLVEMGERFKEALKESIPAALHVAHLTQEVGYLCFSCERGQLILIY